MRRFALSLLLWLVALVPSVMAQMPGGEPVVVSSVKQMIHGQCFYIHVVQRGQTIYAITKAYGLKEYDAVYRKSATTIGIGDTVWLPCRGLDNAAKSTASSQPSHGDKALAANAQQPSSSQSAASTTAQASAQQSTHQPSSVATQQTAVPAGQPIANSGQPVAQPSASSDAHTSRPSEVDKPDVKASAKASAPMPAPTATRHTLEPHGEIRVSLMMPLHIDRLSSEPIEGSPYKPFEFIQFYEGVTLALQRLAEQGIRVELNVVDIPDDNPETVAKQFESHGVAQTDMLIALLTRAPFARAAELAKQHGLPIINPIATRGEILTGNPLLFKCQPSLRSQLLVVLDVVHSTMPGAHLVVVHSGSDKDKQAVSIVSKLLEQRADIDYTILPWSSNSRLQSIINDHSHTVVLSLYNQSHSQNRIFAGMLLNKLSAYRNNPVTLISLTDWSQIFSDIDFAQLQRLSYHTFYDGYCKDDPSQQEFFRTFRNQYFTVPTMQYAAMGNDVATYFVNGLHRYGSQFWSSPNLGHVQGMVMPMSFMQRDPTMGYENQSPRLYRMENLSFVPVR